MAHDQATVRQPSRNRRKQRARNPARVDEIIGAGKRRIDARCRRARRGGGTARSGRRAAAPCGRAEPLRQRPARPHWRTQAFGRGSLHRVEQGVAHLRKQLHVLMAVDEIGRAAEQCRRRPRAAPSISARASRGSSRRSRPRAQHLRRAAGTCRRRAARNAGLSGLNGAGQRDMQADRATRSRAGVEHFSASTSARSKPAPTTITEVALRRPALDQVADRAVDAGADAVIVGAQPDPARRRGIAHSAAVRFGARWRRPARRSALLHAVLGDEIDRPRLQLGQDLADVFADDADHDELHAAQHHQADHQRRIAGHGFAARPGLPQDRQRRTGSATMASSTPSRLASRSGATENDVRPSIDRPTSARGTPGGGAVGARRPARSRRGTGGSRSSSPAP